MQAFPALRLIRTVLLALMLATPAVGQSREATVRVVAYNVLQGRMGTPADFAAALQPLAPDVLLLSEAPGGDWASAVGAPLGLRYVYVGSISSANHPNKFKAILSRTPLSDGCEIRLVSGSGWNPASAVRARTLVNGVPISLYALHIASSGAASGHAEELARTLQGQKGIAILGGDFNLRPGAPGLRAIEAAGFHTVWPGPVEDAARRSSVVEADRDFLIDHIFFRAPGSGHADQARVIKLEAPLSDHHPIAADIQVTEGSNETPAADDEKTCL